MLAQNLTAKKKSLLKMDIFCQLFSYLDLINE